MKLSSATDAKAVRAAAESAAEPRILASDTEKRSDRSVRSPQIEGRNRGTEQEWRARVVARTRNTRPPLHAPLRYTLLHAVFLYLRLQYVRCFNTYLYSGTVIDVRVRPRMHDASASLAATSFL